MPKQIIIAEQHHIAAVFWEDQIQELVVATGHQQVGDTYLGIVENVIPGIDAAFVNIGDAERNGFIHVTDLGPLRLRKASGAITELLAPQQKVLVQVMKEPTGNKGPRLTGNITLPGRYLVLMPYGQGVKLSRRIKNDNERSRLRALAILVKPAGMGILVRTEAEGKAEEAIMEDLEALQKQWDLIQQQSLSSRAPSLLNRDDDFIQRVLRDMYTSEVNRIVVDTQGGLKRVRQQLISWNGGKVPEGLLVDCHVDQQPILDYFRINAAIKEAIKPRVDLPSGGYVIIEPTEALTVIDVNSGSFTRSATSRETVLWTNSEAATEIARQLRLRNIGGVVIVDFIDMDTRRDQLKLLEHFNKAIKSDKARPQIAQLSELGLVELTRKRQGKNLYELFGEICPTCGGLGHVVRLPGQSEPQAIEIPAPSFAITPPNLYKSTEKPQEEPESFFGDDSFDDGEGEPQSAPAPVFNNANYPDQALGSNTIRRRKRRHLGDLLLKEESNDLESIEPELDNEPELPTLRERKERLSLRSSRREESNLENVTVEMTQDEEEVYALMGVNPIIKIKEREFKDPRSVIINISRKSDGRTETFSAPDPSTTKEILPPKPEIFTSVVISKTPEPVNKKPPEPEITQEESINNFGEDFDRRRRRRRTSASS